RVTGDELCAQSESGHRPQATVGDAGKLERRAQLALEQDGVAAHQLDHALAHRAASEQGYPYRLQRITEWRASWTPALGTCGSDARAHPRGRIAQGMADASDRLAGAMLVFDKREAHEAVAIRAEADTGRYSDFCLGEQELGKFKRAHLAKRLGDRRPHEH